MILEIAYAQFSFTSQFAFYLGTFSASLTSFYSFRLINLTFFCYPNASRNLYNYVHDTQTLVIIILIILIFISVFFGYFIADLYIGIGADFIGSSIFIHPTHINIFDAEVINSFIKIIPLILSIFAAAGSIYFYILVPNYLIVVKYINTTGINIYKFFNSKYYIDEIYHFFFIYPNIIFGGVVFKLIDRGLIELFGPEGMTQILFKSSLYLSKFEIRSLYDYNVYLGLSIILSIYFFVPNNTIQNFSIFLNFVTS